MGVRGLTTYVNYNSNSFMHNYHLHDTNLVIDGNSLCAQIYRNTNCFSAFGGDYDKIASYVKTFFKRLMKCKITSYVIFDGSYERRKLKTVYARTRSKINAASRLDPVTQGNLQIFPLLIRHVFREVLNELNVLYTICEFEADDEIASLARFLECPVLSYDSDFFIYNVMYIPFNTIDTKPKLISQENKTYAIECKIYKVEFLTEHFGGLNHDLLPLLATLLGNDFVEKKVFRKFFSQMKLPTGRNKKNEQQRCIHGLFLWLQKETLDSAISKIIGRQKKKEKQKIFYIIKKSINSYYKTDCRSLEFFNLSQDNQNSLCDKKVDISNYTDADETNSSNDSDESSASDSEDDDSSHSVDDQQQAEELIENRLPKWFADGVRLHKIPFNLINLYTLNFHLCSPQAEDYTQDDAQLCTLNILRYSFDMLTDFSEDNFIYVSRDRGCYYKRLYIGKDMSVSRPVNKPYSELSDDELHVFFYHFFEEKLPKLDFSIIEKLPENFRIFAIAMLWWITNCDVKMGHVHSLLLCYTYLEAIDEKLGNMRGNYHFNNKFSKKLLELKQRSVQDYVEEELMNKNKVQYDDCIIAASVLLKHFDLDDSIRKRPKSYDTNRIHVFAQFQCCLLMINSLNTLCGSPFKSTSYSRSYNGTFIYNTSMKLEKENDPMLFLKNYLNGAVTVLKFYESLFTLLKKLFEVMELQFNEIKQGKKKRRGKKKNAIDEELYFLIKDFESDVKI